MYNEHVIWNPSSGESYLNIYRNDKFMFAGRVTHAIEYNNLTKKKIKAWLNGHVLLDTGDMDKLTDKLTYELSEVPYNDMKINKNDKVFFKFGSGRLEGVVVGLGNNEEYFVEVGTYTYPVRIRNIIAVNGISVVTKQPVQYVVV